MEARRVRLLTVVLWLNLLPAQSGVVLVLWSELSGILGLERKSSRLTNQFGAAWKVVKDFGFSMQICNKSVFVKGWS